MKRRLAALAAAVALAFGGCSSFNEDHKYNVAVRAREDSGAYVINTPFSFSSVAVKCFDPYVVFVARSDGGLFVVEGPCPEAVREAAR